MSKWSAATSDGYGKLTHMKNWQFWMLFLALVAVYLAVVNH